MGNGCRVSRAIQNCTASRPIPSSVVASLLGNHTQTAKEDTGQLTRRDAGLSRRRARHAKDRSSVRAKRFSSRTHSLGVPVAAGILEAILSSAKANPAGPLRMSPRRIA